MLQANTYKKKRCFLWLFTVFLPFINFFSLFISTNSYPLYPQHKIELFCKTTKAVFAKSVSYPKTAAKVCVQKNSYLSVKGLKMFLKNYNVVEKIKFVISKQRATSFINWVCLTIYTVYHTTSVSISSSK